MKRLLALAVLLGAFGVTPAHAATPRPSMTVHYVYNWTNPTVEVIFKNISGTKDIYAHGDNGYYLIAEDFVFDKTKVYDGLYSVGRVQQEDVFLTAPNAGPYGDHSTGGSTAATAGPTWVAPTLPPGSINITLDNLGPWWRND